MQIGAHEVAIILEDLLRIERNEEIEGMLENLITSIKKVFEFRPIVQTLSGFCVVNVECVRIFRVVLVEDFAGGRLKAVGKERTHQLQKFK